MLGHQIGCRTKSPPGSAAPSPAPSRRPVVKISIRGHLLNAEVARTPEEKAVGLMFRSYLAPDSGMLFIFDRDDTLRFWMKNCYIPLAIAFIDSAWIISDIMEMAPLDTVTRYRSSRPVRYALEAVSGWFTAHGIQPGDTVQILNGWENRERH